METTLFVTKEYLEKQFKSFNNTLVKPNDKKIKEWLTTLNGDVDVEGSIANTIAKKIASVISGAPEEYDTLKEIADWISNHASNAEEMLAKIEANKEGILSENEKIELVEGIISTLNGNVDEEGSIAKMLKDAINTSVDNIIICESENEDIDFNNASWLKGEVEPLLFTADMVPDKSITSFVIPEGYTEIGNFVFSGCDKLASVTLPSTLKKIGQATFSNCSSLTSIDIPEGVTEIGRSAFSWCTSLTSIAIPGGVTKIGGYAFTDWSIVEFAEGSPFKKENGIIWNTETGVLVACYDKNITSLNIPEGVTEIGDGAFKDCKLASVTLPSTLKKIGSSAFYGCSLTSVVIPEGVTEIGESAFGYCESLESVTLPSTLTKIGSGVFNSCSSLTEIYIPSSVTEIGTNTFEGCDLGCIIYPDEEKWNELEKNNEYLKNLRLAGKVVHSKECQSFKSNTELTHYEIPYETTKIPDNAFNGCTNLESVTIPSTVTEIGRNAFAGCYALTSIEIPEGVQEFNDANTFSDWSKVTFAEGSPFVIQNDVVWNTETGVLIAHCNKDSETVNIPEGVTKIQTYAFINRPNLKNVIIPEGVTEIGNSIFQGSYNFKSVTLPSTLTKIGDYAFNNTSGFQTVIPASVTEIGSYAFVDWVNITFAEGSPFKKENGIIWNTETGVLVACYDKNITSLNIPEGVTDIRGSAFSTCTKLTSVTLPSTLTKIGDQALYNCKALESIDIPEGVTEIGNNSFSYCSSLTSIEIPEGVTEIGDLAFQVCTKLTSVTLPSTLTKIGNGVFNWCSSLTTINYTGTEEQWNAITKGAGWNSNTPSDMQIVYNYQG